MRGNSLIVKSFCVALVCITLGGMFGASVNTAYAASTIYVPDDYLTIQAGVDAASSGDTIIVKDGTYTENINVNTDNLTIQSANGANATIVQADNSSDHVFEIMADYVTLQGFTVKGANGTGKSGVYLDE
ncbi:cell surface protein, partial [Chloroflexota bacterium]